MQRDLRLWQAYATFTTLLLAVFAFSAFRASGHEDFDQINVHRINVVGPDGRTQLVISNRQDMPEGVMDGKTFPSQGRHDGAGLIFYNALGDEDGGLTFGAVKTAHGYAASGGLLFDQFKQDQTVGLVYDEQDGQRSAGLRVWQRPDRDLAQEVEAIQAMRAMPAGTAKDRAMAAFQRDRQAGKYGAQRLFAGRTPKEDAAVVLSDSAGHPRLRLTVTSAGQAAIEFLDASGKVTARLPRN